MAVRVLLDFTPRPPRGQVPFVALYPTRNRGNGKRGSVQSRRSCNPLVDRVRMYVHAIPGDRHAHKQPALQCQVTEHATTQGNAACL